MQRRVIIPSLVLLTLSVSAQEIATSVYFPIGNSALDESGQLALDEVCATLPNDRTGLVIGHSDDQGAPDLNQRISMERAQQVSTYLQCNCPKLTVRSVLAAGGKEPVANNATVTGRAMNRRVELVLDPLPAPTQTTAELFDPLTQHGHRLVTPLMPAADKPRELHHVDASSAIEERMSDGTILRIPAGALVDAQGQPITGTVDLTYRSFLDPWEVVASGIPMHIAQNDETRHFETAGMYEVYATCEGRTVRLREDAEMTLETFGPNVTADYGAFALDERTGTWQVAGGIDGATFGSYRPPSRAVRTYNSMLRRLPNMPDSTVFEDRQASPDYCYTEPCMATRKAYLYDKGKYRSPYNDGRIPGLRVIHDRRYWKEHHRVAFTVSVRYRQHPEWGAFPQDKRWLYSGPLDYRDFRRTISRKHYYQDIKLEAGTNTLHGEVALKDRGTWVGLPVEFMDTHDEELDADILGTQLALYQKRLSKKVTRFDDRLRNDVLRNRTERERLFTKAYSKASTDMDSTEQAMTKEAFDVYALTATTGGNTYQRDNAYIYSRRPTFTVPSFGLWNCDRTVPIPLNEVPVRVLASSGEPMKWVKAYGVPADGRAVITYWNPEAKTTLKLRLSPKCERIIFVDGDRNMVVADVPAGKRNRPGLLSLDGRPLEQPSDRSMIASLALQK